jgi:hypothetical protein
MFSYTDEQGNAHEVWFENSESIIAKLRLAWQQGYPAWLSGDSEWKTRMSGAVSPTKSYQKELYTRAGSREILVILTRNRHFSIFPCFACNAGCAVI